MIRTVFTLSLCLPSMVFAAEGMWTPDQLPRSVLKQQYDFEPDAKWVDHVMKASVRLANGCSGAFVSPNGLVLTNAHCVMDCVQGLSSAKRDHVRQGFVAGKREQELQCPAAEANRLEQVADVTQRMAKATQGRSGQAFIEARNAEQGRIESECVADQVETRRCEVVELYGGGQSQLYRYRRFQDVRLVFSPEYASAFFGGDADNFNFPRYNLDMGFLRVYDEGKPAATLDHFPVKRAGAKQGELTIVAGHPGTTDRQLTVAQLERLRDVDLLDAALYYTERRAMLAHYSRRSAEAARQARSDLTFTENGFKVLRGQLAALSDPQVMAGKRSEEAALRKAAETEEPWEDISRAQRAWREIATAKRMLEDGQAFYSRHFSIARQLVRAAEERGKPNTQRLPEYQDASVPRLKQSLLSTAPIHAEYETAKLSWSLSKLREALGPDDALVKLVLRHESPDVLAARMVKTSQLSDLAERERLWNGGLEVVAQSRDPFIMLARAVDAVSRQLRSRYESEVESVEARNARAIAKLRFESLGTDVYPDATFTLRLSFGEVKGWEDKGGAVAPFTDFAGLYARNTGVEPYALPKRWLDAKTRLRLDTPLNFVTDNDITGGNSGSPVLNREAEVVGLAFDGNIHSLGGNFWFDERLNRSVAVHSGAMLEALEKVYAAPSWVKELTVR